MATQATKAALQTVHAIKASDLAAASNEALKKVRIAPGDYTPELTEPEGPSTSGGVQAMQHLRLVSVQPSRPTLVVGNANHAAGTAELRTYDYLDSAHRERFGKPLDLDRAQYDAFIGFAKLIFRSLHLETSVVDAEAPPNATSVDDAPGSKLRIVPFAVAAVIVGVTIGAWILLGRG
jgi:hypothetical protein